MGGCNHQIFSATCPHCLALQREYYKKLEMTGWKDIEDTKHPLRPLLVWHSLKANKIDPDYYHFKLTYYQKARDLLHTFEFKNDIHRKIWELHSEGLSKKKIEIALKNSECPYKRESIGLIIKKIAEEMK